MKRFTSTIVLSVFAVAVFLTIGVVPATSAQGSTQAGVQAAQGSGVPTTLFGDGGIITSLTNTLLFVVGALSVIMIIFGGIRYATSAGNASSVTAAKNTILYAIVGLIIAFLAFAIVNWVLGAIATGAGGGASNL